MREARRLVLLRRQALIADVARKQALRTLAEARDAERRSDALARRARALVAASAPGAGTTTGAALQARADFTAGLAQLALEAGEGAQDAARQSAWAGESLARAEARARRIAELVEEARVALVAARARRQGARDLPLARKLQSRSDD